MKLIMAIAAVLTVPALAFGGASFTLEFTGGATEMTINDLISAGGLTSVDIGITTTAAGCAGFDVALATSTDDAISQTGRTVHLSYWGFSKADKALFTTYKLLKTSPTGDQNLGGTYAYGTGSWTPAIVANCMTVNLEADTAAIQAAGFPYVISIAGAGVTGLSILDNSSPVEDIYDREAPLAQVVITPEPASMLLLIGALPLLRRRRSA